LTLCAKLVKHNAFVVECWFTRHS